MSNTSTSQHIIQEQSIQQQSIPNQGSRTRVPTPPVAPYIDATRTYNRIRNRISSPNRISGYLY